MIALVLEERCDGCGACVAACPGDVLEASDGIVAIARQTDCQTCFMCELYCPSDALYVDPTCDAVVRVDAGDILKSGVVGSFRRNSGWHEWEGDPRYPNEHWRMGEIFAAIRATPPAAHDG